MAIYPKSSIPKWQPPVRITRPYIKPNFLADTIGQAIQGYGTIQNANLKNRMFTAQLARQQQRDAIAAEDRKRAIALHDSQMAKREATNAAIMNAALSGRVSGTPIPYNPNLGSTGTGTTPFTPDVGQEIALAGMPPPLATGSTGDTFDSAAAFNAAMAANPQANPIQVLQGIDRMNNVLFPQPKGISPQFALSLSNRQDRLRHQQREYDKQDAAEANAFYEEMMKRSSWTPDKGFIETMRYDPDWKGDWTGVSGWNNWVAAATYNGRHGLYTGKNALSGFKSEVIGPVFDILKRKYGTGREGQAIIQGILTKIWEAGLIWNDPSDHEAGLDRPFDFEAAKNAIPNEIVEMMAKANKKKQNAVNN
jgi:hypothetical protein